MANLTSALQQLREERKQAQYQVEKLESAISVLEDLVGRNGSLTRTAAGESRVITATARRRMAAAQSARWAKVGNRIRPRIPMSRAQHLRRSEHYRLRLGGRSRRHRERDGPGSRHNKRKRLRKGKMNNKAHVIFGCGLCCERAKT